MPEKGALLISHITPNLISHIHQIWAAQSAITEIHMEFTAGCVCVKLKIYIFLFFLNNYNTLHIFFNNNNIDSLYTVPA